VTTQPLGNGATKVILEVSAAALSAPRQEETLNIYTDDPELSPSADSDHAQQDDARRRDGEPGERRRCGWRFAARSAAQRERSDGAHRQGRSEPSCDQVYVGGRPGNDATLKIAVDARQLKSDAKTNVRVHAGASIIAIPVTLRKE